MSGIWDRVERIGRATLYLGDCRQIVPHIRGVNSILTDPPYGISYKSGHATDDLWAGGDEIAGDGDTAARDWVAAHYEKLPQIHFGTWRADRPSKTKMVLIWDKKGALGMGDLRIPWKPDHEEMYVLGDGFVGKRDCGSVIPCPPVQSTHKNGRRHPNEKPVQLMMALARKLPGKILDPFMGSGSTIVAATKMARPAIGIEVNPEYFEIACSRVSDALAQPGLLLEEST